MCATGAVADIDTMGASLLEHLSAQLRVQPPAPLCVALSGGGDSAALLHALAQLSNARERGLRAAHVDHGLHADSASWAARCQALCEALDVPLTLQRVDVEVGTEGLEAAARDARYRVLGEQLAHGEWLLTAHHRDDQAETVLLKLLRGAGPHGLGAMRPRRPLAKGLLWRPLLTLPRSALRTYADAHGLDIVDDPSNDDPALARNFLRRQILPALSPHWPEAPRILARAARLQRDVADFLDMQIDLALTTLRAAPDDSLDADHWRSLHPALRPLVLERWLHEHGLPPPSEAQREALELQITSAAADRLPQLSWPGAEIRVWRRRLFALPPLPAPPRDWHAVWDGERLTLPPGCGELAWISSTTESDARHASTPRLQVRLGVNGVRLRPAGDRHTRVLRDLYQRAGIPPWRRRRCPLLYADDGTLLAVADLWITEAGRRCFMDTGVTPHWQPGC